MKEVFRDIKNYEGLYQISDKGTVKRLKGFRVPNDRLLKQYINKKGYYVIGLSKNGKEKKKRVHVLEAEAFLNHSTDNKFNLIVDHKNNIKTDNDLTNLQVITVRKNSSKDQFRYNRTSNYTGVNLNKRKKDELKWRSQIMIGKTNYHLGAFKNEKEAHLEYQKALYHLERNIDGLDNYHFEKAPIKHKVFLNEMYQNYLV